MKIPEGIKFNANTSNAVYVASAACLAGSSLLFGMAAGYALCRKDLTAKFDARLDAEVASLKANYAKRLFDVRADVDQFNAQIDKVLAELKKSGPVYDVDGYELQPSDVHAEFGDGDLADSGADYEDDGLASVGDPDAASDDIDHEDRPANYVHVAEHEKRPLDTKNIFSDSSLEDVTLVRDTSKPYGIGIEEFCDPPDGYRQITITYYASDKVLVDDKNGPILDIVKTVGPLTALDFGGISGDPHIRYVRNPNLDADFEIILNAGSYAEEILHYGRPNKPQED